MAQDLSRLRPRWAASRPKNARSAHLNGRKDCSKSRVKAAGRNKRETTTRPWLISDPSAAKTAVANRASRSMAWGERKLKVAAREISSQPV